MAKLTKAEARNARLKSGGSVLDRSFGGLHPGRSRSVPITGRLPQFWRQLGRLSRKNVRDSRELAGNSLLPTNRESLSRNEAARAKGYRASSGRTSLP